MIENVSNIICMTLVIIQLIHVKKNLELMCDVPDNKHLHKQHR